MFAIRRHSPLKSISIPFPTLLRYPGPMARAPARQEACEKKHLGALQKKGGLVCVPLETGKCPVSGFRFSPKGSTSPSLDVSVLNYNGTHDLVVERGGDPLVSIAVQEARICNGTETPPITNGRAPFSYFLEKKQECDKNIDERYTVVSSFAEDDFFKSNDAKLADVLLNAKALSGQYLYSIQTRVVSPYAQFCRKQMDIIPQILQKEMLVESSASSVRLLIWLMFYFLIVLILVACGAFCARKSLGIAKKNCLGLCLRRRVSQICINV